jgi:DNA-binding response OmpR family regulator
MNKIIIIEDDTLLNKTLAYNLISDGYEVVSAYSCSMAKSLLKKRYQLPLLDINLPDGTGFDLCSEAI